MAHHTAARGREPGLSLLRNGQEVALSQWGAEIVEALEPIARRLDLAHRTRDYSAAVQSARDRLSRPDTTPSARVVA